MPLIKLFYVYVFRSNHIMYTRFPNKFYHLLHYNLLHDLVGAYVCYRLISEHADDQYYTW